MSGAVAFWAVVVVKTLPNYVESGRALGNFWHRAFVSFVLHPDWPFGNLHDVYKCPVYPKEGLSRQGSPDANAFCVWGAEPKNSGMSASDLRYSYFSGDYEKSVRAAYFYVVTHYPKQVFELYTVVKSQGIYYTLQQSLYYLFDIFEAHAPKRLLAVVALQCALFIYSIFLFCRNGADFVKTQFVILMTLFVLSIAPRYVAWSSIDTGIDMIFLMYASLVLALMLIVRFLVGLVASRKPEPSPA